MASLNYTKSKFIWTDEDGIEHDLSLYVKNISTSENFEPQNNVCDIELLDNNEIYDDSFVFQPKEGDSVTVWAKVVTSNAETAFDTNDIIWEGYFVDHTRKDSPDSKTVQFTLVDYNYDLFNRMWSAKDKYIGTSFRTDQIVLDITQSLMETESGFGTYKVGTSNIATTRDDGSNFPVIEPSHTNKPVYEWLKELSQTNFTNSEAEIAAGSLVHTKPMVYKIRQGEAYWYYPGSSVLTIDETTTIEEIKQETGNQKSANFLILECGEDIDGDVIFTYIRNENSDSNVQKDAYEPVLKLAGKDNTYDNTYHSLRARAIARGDSANGDFYDEVVALARSYAKYWFEYVNKGRTEITITLPKTEAELGTIVTMALPKYEAGEYMIDNVSHNISARGWTTTLRLIKEPEN